MTVSTMDPALKRLLDNLPQGNPDPAPGDQVEVRVAHCETVHVIPNGVPMKLRFGPWAGPPTLASEIQMTAKNLRTGHTVHIKDLRRSKDGADVLIKPKAFFSVEWIGTVV